MRPGLRLVVTLLIGCLLTVGIAACGGGEDDGSGTSDGSSEIKGTVTVWDFEYESFPGYTKAVDQLNAEFEKEHPGVTVDWVGQPYETYEATYRAAFAAQEGPDVMAMQSGAAGILSFDQGLEVFNDHISPDLEEHMTNWQSVTPGLAREGDRYGVPVSLNGNVFYYNKKLFEKAGLPTDFQPESWEELREAGEKLKQAGIQPFTGGNKEGLENSFWWSVGFQTQNSDEEITELAEGAMPFTDPAFERGFDPLIEMTEADLFPKDFFTTPWVPDGYASFAEEEGAMILGWWSQIGYWGEFNPAIGEENVGIFFAPGGTQIGSNASFSFTVPKFAENKDAAWALLNYYGGKHANEVLYEVGGNLPIRNDVELPAKAPRQAVELVDASREQETAASSLAGVQSNIALVAMPTEINQVLQGRTSLQDALSAMQETYEKSNSH
ncbi:MAG TPA: ABC transporter substrate-binding protein [Solirubrobacterales bacterium]|nr:ABC transporter substrate-binding protein [Solirubrobacterales bacterium]